MLTANWRLLTGNTSSQPGSSVLHDDLHLIEVLVPAQFGGPFDAFQLGRGFRVADPVLAACVVKANFGVPEEDSHYAYVTPPSQLCNGVFTPGWREA